MKRRREASLEEGALGRVLGEAERALVGEHGLALASHGAHELGVRGVEEVVVGQWDRRAVRSPEARRARL
jgi:hypothetical protein